MKKLRKAEKRQRREDSNSFFYDLCSEGEVSLRVLRLFRVSLPCFSIPETTYPPPVWVLLGICLRSNISLSLLCVFITIIFVIGK